MTMNSSIPTSPSHAKPPLPDSAAAIDQYVDGTAASDMDQFAKTVANIKSKNVRPDLLASIITHYASKWLPELSPGNSSAGSASPVGTTAGWLKKRFFIENLIDILPPEDDSMPPEFLLKLLRAASMVRAGPAYLADLEARVSHVLDRASLKEVMIPAFSHTCGTLLDVGLMVRLVLRFLASEEAARSGVAMVRVAKLVDSYMAEVAMDAGLAVAEFEQLATAMPSHSRTADDGLYRAVDTYIKVSVLAACALHFRQSSACLHSESCHTFVSLDISLF